MRAMVVRRYGPPEVFALTQAPDPQPASGQLLIRVKAVGINFADLLQRMGLYPGTPKPPFTPGLEVAGTIEASPSNLQPLTPNLQPGDGILVHGAAGGVGIAAVQLARTRSLVIFGTAGPSKQDLLRQIGVHHPIDYSREDFQQVVRSVAPEGIEMVMDPIGGKSFAKSCECLGPTGRLVVYGFSAAAGPEGKRSLWRGLKALSQTPRFHPLCLMRRNISVIGVNLGRMSGREALLRRQLEELFRMYAAGQIKPVIGKTFPLEHAAEAHRYIHARQNVGKVILTVA